MASSGKVDLLRTFLDMAGVQDPTVYDKLKEADLTVDALQMFEDEDIRGIFTSLDINDKQVIDNIISLKQQNLSGVFGAAAAVDDGDDDKKEEAPPSGPPSGQMPPNQSSQQPGPVPFQFPAQTLNQSSGPPQTQSAAVSAALADPKPFPSATAHVPPGEFCSYKDRRVEFDLFDKWEQTRTVRLSEADVQKRKKDGESKKDERLYTCVICLELYAAGQDVITLNYPRCGHTYHFECFREWGSRLIANGHRPMCPQDNVFIRRPGNVDKPYYINTKYAKVIKRNPPEQKRPGDGPSGARAGGGAFGSSSSSSSTGLQGISGMGAMAAHNFGGSSITSLAGSGSSDDRKYPQ